MSLLEAKNVTVRIGERTILDGVGFTLEEGRWLMVVGPNGAGKSTLINAVTQALPYTGSVLCLGRELRRFRPRERARLLGVLAQNHYVGYAFTVEEVVRLGRYAHTNGPLAGKAPGDETAVQRALSLTGLTDIAGQSVLTLSGGELQRAFLAQVLAQEPRVLLLDEPTNHLDLVYQKQIFALIRDWLAQEPGRAALSVVHDLSLARAYGSDALLLHGGKTVALGPTAQVFTPEKLDPAYDMDVGDWMRSLLGQWQ